MKSEFRSKWEANKVRKQEDGMGRDEKVSYYFKTKQTNKSGTRSVTVGTALLCNVSGMF